MTCRLPNDVVFLILEQVTDKRDMNTLCQVSKTFNRFMTPRLWRDLTIQVRDEQTLHEVWFPTDIDGNGNVKDLMNYIKTVEVSSHFHQVTLRRCLHYEEIPSLETEDMEIPCMARLGDSVRKTLKNIENESLEKFTWWTGTCIPLEIVMDLNTFQKSIKHLSLCTGGPCVRNLNDESPIDLSGLLSLQALSWSNIHSISDLSSLQTLIKKNRQNLRELKLDFGNMSVYDYEEWDNLDGNRFAIHVIGLDQECPENDSERILYPRLEVLSIAGVDLERIGTRLLHAFNFRELTSLSLRDCGGTDEFMKAMTDIHDPKTPIKLTSLEIVCANDSVWNRDALRILVSAEFRIYFKFRNLFIDINGPAEEAVSRLLEVLLLQKKSLERFVYHQRCFHHLVSVDGMLKSHPAMSITQYEIDQLLLHPQSRQPFKDMSLKCLGLSCSPDAMHALIIPFTKRTTLQILHMRKCLPELPHPCHGRRFGTGEYEYYAPKSDDCIANKLIVPPWEDPLWPFHATKNGEIAHLPLNLLDFLKWLFGPDGVTSLRVFAFGDFSHNGRYRAYNHIFCRRGEPVEELRERDEPELELSFRPIRETDYVLWDLIEKNKDFLAACPTEYLVYD